MTALTASVETAVSMEADRSGIAELMVGRGTIGNTMHRLPRLHDNGVRQVPILNQAIQDKPTRLEER